MLHRCWLSVTGASPVHPSEDGMHDDYRPLDIRNKITEVKLMKRTDWYNNEKQVLEISGLDMQARQYIMALLIRAINECGTISKNEKN